MRWKLVLNLSYRPHTQTMYLLCIEIIIISYVVICFIYAKSSGVIFQSTSHYSSIKYSHTIGHCVRQNCFNPLLRLCVCVCVTAQSLFRAFISYQNKHTQTHMVFLSLNTQRIFWSPHRIYWNHKMVILSKDIIHLQVSVVSVCVLLYATNIILKKQ